MLLNFIYNDGGRQKAGYKGSTQDCVTRAIAIATGKPYKMVYEDIRNIQKEYSKTRRDWVARNQVCSPRVGVHKEISRLYLTKLGWKWKPLMKIGTGCTTHLRKGELPNRTIIAQCSKHLVCVKKGVINDLYDCSRDGNRCVYGYYYKPNLIEKFIDLLKK